MELKNIAAPNLEGKSTDQKFYAMLEYMEQFKQYLTHTLQNLDTTNMTQEVAQVIQQAVNNTGGINETVSMEKFTTAIKQTAESIALLVSKNGVISAINQSSEVIKIAAAKLILEGLITANGNFKILTDGSTEQKNGKFSGTVEAVSGSFTRLKVLDGTSEILDFGADAAQGGWLSSALRLLIGSGVGISVMCPSGYIDLYGNVGVNGVPVPKIIRGTTSISASTSASIDYSAAGFIVVPQVIACWAKDGSNVSGDFGAIKVYGKTTTGAAMIAGGSLPSSVQLADWIAIGI